MAKPRLKITILFDLDDKSKIPGELLEDLWTIMSQYGLKVATVTMATTDKSQSLEEVEQPIMEKVPETHECKILRFPRDRSSDDGDSV